jgi:hypothetical protein
MIWYGTYSDTARHHIQRRSTEISPRTPKSYFVDSSNAKMTVSTTPTTRLSSTYYSYTICKGSNGPETVHSALSRTLDHPRLHQVNRPKHQASVPQRAWERHTRRSHRHCTGPSYHQA